MRSTFCTALVLLLALGGGRASAGTEPEVARVRATASGVSVQAHEVPRGEVLRALATEMAVEVRGRARVDERITVRFDEVPLPEALRNVLGSQSFLVRYGPDGRPRAIELLGAGTEVMLEPPPEMASDAEGTPGNAPSMPGARRAYPIDGRLAGAMGADTASFDDLLGFAVRTSDPSLQRAAIVRGLSILEHEPELRAVLLSIAQRAPGQLARYAVAAAGDGAEAFVGTVAGAIGDGARTQADAVRREVRVLNAR
jgi:hypothetical protein